MKYYNTSIMNLSELIRNRAFFTMDKALNKGVSIHLKDIETKMNGGSNSKDEREALLKHAMNTVDYYKNMKEPTIDHFPVIDKSIIREHDSQFISNQYTLDQLYKVTTSGSHGTPMKFYRTKDKKIRQIAEVIYFGTQTNFYFGMRRGFIRATHPKGKLSLFVQNEVHIDPTKLSEDSLEKIRGDLKQLKVIVGFPSTLTEIANYCLEKGDNPSTYNLKGIITTAEPLLDSQREVIEKAFGCPVHTRYATEELGLVAIQHPDDASYRVNQATFYVEILKLDSDEPCAEGEEGRIVVTDLYSYAMPLIRYDTGDLGRHKIINKNGKREMYLTSISGRKIEMILTPEGEKISPFSINVRMKDVQHVKRFQFIQKSQNQYVMKLIVDKNYRSSEDIVNLLKDILGETANIEVEIVDQIPTLPSGKTPYIINEYMT